MYFGCQSVLLSEKAGAEKQRFIKEQFHLMAGLHYHFIVFSMNQRKRSSYSNHQKKSHSLTDSKGSIKKQLI